MRIKLRVGAVFISTGLIFALAILALGLAVMFTNYGDNLAMGLTGVLPGFEVTTFMGLAIGAGWGFVFGGIIGFVWSFLYNRFA